MSRIILKSVDAIVMKNTEFDVKAPEKDWDWDPATHAIYKDLIGQRCQSVQISDQKEIYKTGWKAWMFDNIPFGTPGKITISFEPKN